jgi:hypothetical protein
MRRRRCVAALAAGTGPRARRRPGHPCNRLRTLRGRRDPRLHHAGPEVDVAHTRNRGIVCGLVRNARETTRPDCSAWLSAATSTPSRQSTNRASPEPMGRWFVNGQPARSCRDCASRIRFTLEATSVSAASDSAIPANSGPHRTDQPGARATPRHARGPLPGPRHGQVAPARARYLPARCSCSSSAGHL